MSNSNGVLDQVQAQPTAEPVSQEPAKPPETAKRKYPPKPETFKLLATVGDDVYQMWPLKVDDPKVKFLLRVQKIQGKEPDTYDVHLDKEGKFHCQCRGHLRYGACKSGKGCRHVRLLRALLKVFGKGAPDA
jgi:hypothetical protein